MHNLDLSPVDLTQFGGVVYAKEKMLEIHRHGAVVDDAEARLLGPLYPPNDEVAGEGAYRPRRGFMA